MDNNCEASTLYRHVEENNCEASTLYRHVVENNCEASTLYRHVVYFFIYLFKCYFFLTVTHSANILALVDENGSIVLYDTNKAGDAAIVTGMYKYVV